MKIIIDSKVIKVTKLADGSYDFIMEYVYLEYKGNSFLKEIKIDDFDEYVDYCTSMKKINLKLVGDNYILELPVPFKRNCEIVMLKRPEITEAEELKILIKKQQSTIDMLSRKLNNLTNPAHEYVHLDFSTRDIQSTIKYGEFKKFIQNNIKEVFTKVDGELVYALKQSASYDEYNAIFKRYEPANKLTFNAIFKLLQGCGYMIYEWQNTNSRQSNYAPYICQFLIQPDLVSSMPQLVAVQLIIYIQKNEFVMEDWMLVTTDYSTLLVDKHKIIKTEFDSIALFYSENAAEDDDDEDTL